MTEENNVEETTAETPAPVVEEAAPVQETAPAPAEAKGRGRRQVLQGTVVSAKMDKTVVVSVVSTVMHPLYLRYIKRSAKFYAHDETNECQAGDEVAIVSTRPLSKRKRWRVREILKRAE